MKGNKTITFVPLFLVRAGGLGVTGDSFSPLMSAGDWVSDWAFFSAESRVDSESVGGCGGVLCLSAFVREREIYIKYELFVFTNLASSFKNSESLRANLRILTITAYKRKVFNDIITHLRRSFILTARLNSMHGGKIRLI